MYVGEIRMFAGNFAPLGWALCDGALLQIAENETLFSLIGTMYGGDGATTFAVPDMRGRVPVHRGLDTPLPSLGGTEQEFLSNPHLPPHTHLLGASASAPAPATSRHHRRCRLRARLAAGQAAPVCAGRRVRRHGRQCGAGGGRLPAAQQHGALPGRLFHHQPVWHLPAAGLRRQHVRPFHRRDPHVCR